MSLQDDLMSKLKALSSTAWERRVEESDISAWLDNFAPPGGSPDERLHALYLLSHFMFFGTRQMRELMRVLYRDLFRYPIVASIRKRHGDTTDTNLINAQFNDALERTLFLGVGNPSESGCHLLYYFRQENGLPKTRFIHTHEIFSRRLSWPWKIWNSLFYRWRKGFAATQSLRHPTINHYVFIDDFCGSGSQGISYSKDIVEDIKSADPKIEVHYFALFATTKGMEKLRSKTAFDRIECIYELDDSFRCFSPSSRYFAPAPAKIDKAFAQAMCQAHGAALWPPHPLGYGDCQLLLGFSHNTPDNSLPIFWYDEPTLSPWVPVFKRYMKHYA